MIATGSTSTVLANSAAAISGRLSMPTPLSTRRGGWSCGRAALSRSIRFLALRRLARSGAATTITSSAAISVRRDPAAPAGAAGRATIQGVEARIASISVSNDVSGKSSTRSSVAGAASRLRWSPHLDEQPIDQHSVDALGGEHRVRHALGGILVVVEPGRAEGEVEIGDDRRHCPSTDGERPCEIVRDRSKRRRRPWRPITPISPAERLGAGRAEELRDRAHEIDDVERRHEIFADAARHQLAIKQDVVGAPEHDDLGPGVATVSAARRAARSAPPGRRAPPAR